MTYKEKLPLIALNQDEKTWLSAARDYLFSEGKPPVYNILRDLTKERTSLNFVPLNIDSRLIRNRGTEITLLGILSIDPTTSIIKDLNLLIDHIKRSINDDADKIHYDIVSIAYDMNKDSKYLRIIFELLSEYGSFYDSKSKNESENDLWGYNRFDITSERVISYYLSFNNVEDLLIKYYEIQNSMISSEYAVNVVKPSNINEYYIDPNRIQELKSLTQNKFDLSKLIRICEELNSNYKLNNFYSCSFLIRAILNHVPPALGFETFKEVANNYSSKGANISFKRSMENLEKSCRNIADLHSHSVMRKSESLPSKTQINFSQDIDLLLGEIIRILN